MFGVLRLIAWTLIPLNICDMFTSSTLGLLLGLASIVNARTLSKRVSGCRVQPGDDQFPSQEEWAKLDSEVGGRLIAAVPSAQFCHNLPAGNCTFEQWSSSIFMTTNPGSMLAVRYLSSSKFSALILFTLRQTGNKSVKRDSWTDDQPY